MTGGRVVDGIRLAFAPSEARNGCDGDDRITDRRDRRDLEGRGEEHAQTSRDAVR